MVEPVKLIECPRDAWQGLPQVIPTAVKAAHLRALVDAGFRHIDAVSFVSPQHVRQMADSEAVLEAFFSSLPPGAEAPEIIGIVVNEKGMERGLVAPGVTTLGYPYSISAYSARQCQYVAGGIARFSRTTEKSYKGGGARTGGLCFYGFRESL